MFSNVLPLWLPKVSCYTFVTDDTCCLVSLHRIVLGIGKLSQKILKSPKVSCSNEQLAADGSCCLVQTINLSRRKYLNTLLALSPHNIVLGIGKFSFMWRFFNVSSLLTNYTSNNHLSIHHTKKHEVWHFNGKNICFGVRSIDHLDAQKWQMEIIFNFFSSMQNT